MPKHCNEEFPFLFFFVFAFVFTSHFIIGDSGNLLCSCRTHDPGKNEEKNCWLVCVCVYVLVATVTSSLLSPFHLRASKLVLRPFHASLFCLR